MENKEIKQILEKLIENDKVKDITLNESNELIFRDLDGKLHLVEPITKFKKEEISYRIVTDKNKEVIIQDKQLGIQVILDNGE